MNKSLVLGYIALLLMACLKRGPSSSNMRPPNGFCGDSVLWSLHLHEGFLNNNIEFVVNGNKTDQMSKISTFENGCTSVRLLALREQHDKIGIYMINSPVKKERYETNNLSSDSVQLELIVDTRKYFFKFPSMSEYRFYGLSIKPTTNQIIYIKSKECITCR